jgi:hypothetical protein
MASDTFTDLVLSEWSKMSPSGIIDKNNIDELHRVLSEKNFPVELIVEFLSNYESILNKLTIRDTTDRDMVLTVKQSFVDKLSKLNAEWGALVSNGDEIVRQSTTVEDGDKVEMNPSSLRLVEKPGDTSWKIKNLPNVVFYASIGDNMNGMLKRSAAKTSRLQSTDTEALHECFFVISMAAQIDTAGTSAGVMNVTDIAGINALIDSTRISILNKEKIRGVFSSILSNGEKIPSDVNDRKVDAHRCAVAAYRKLESEYGNESFEYVTRVFDGVKGRKVVADILVKVGGEEMIISLKYKKGQLNNLNCNTVIKNLFGIEPTQISFMDALYEFSPEPIDNLLRYFINGINQINPPKNKSFYVDGSTVTYPDFKKIISSNPYYPLSYTTISGEIVKNDPKAKDFVNEYKRLKTANLVKTIEDYIFSKQTPNTNFVKFLSYVLRCEPSKSYMYVGDSGRAVYTIPSIDSMMEREILITTEPKLNVTDYSAFVSVFVDGNRAFDFDVNFRWTKSQWVGDMSQVGKNLKVYKINW